MRNLIPTRAAAVIYALSIGTFGALHFKNADIMGGGIPDYMPGDPKIWVYVTGTALILAALAIIINKYAKIACYLLALMLLIFVFALHLKPAMDGNMTMLLKDTGLAMAAIIIGNMSK